MKIYVDELPNSCKECPCLHIDEWCAYCNINAFDGNNCLYRELDKQRHKDCPLTLIYDHDKQVRKEVCDEIYDKCGKKIWTNDEGFDCVDIDNIKDILDQIQGEAK